MRDIRPYRAEDASHVDICFVELQTVEQRIEPNRVDGQAIAAAYRHDLLERCAHTDGVIFVAEESGQVIGFVAVLAHVDSESMIEADRDYAYISDLIVLPKYRGQGVGRALMLRAESYARERGANILKVDVLTANSGAYRLYQHLGFHDHEIRLTKPLLTEIPSPSPERTHEAAQQEDDARPPANKTP
jgi:ribosomal protein S18 acetylase RimI-like enzyme